MLGTNRCYQTIRSPWRSFNSDSSKVLVLEMKLEKQRRRIKRNHTQEAQIRVLISIWLGRRLEFGSSRAAKEKRLLIFYLRNFHGAPPTGSDSAKIYRFEDCLLLSFLNEKQRDRLWDGKFIWKNNKTKIVEKSNSQLWRDSFSLNYIIKTPSFRIFVEICILLQKLTF